MNRSLPGNQPSFALVSASSSAAVMCTALPAFLLGAFGPRIKEDLGIGDTAFGLIFTFGYLTSSIAIVIGGSLADGFLGPRRAVRTGLVFVVLSAFLFGLGASTYLAVIVAYCISRVGESFTQPATNALISRSVLPTRRGSAMGVKQAAVPVATVLGGLAVPTLGSAFSWRAPFVAIAVIAVPLFFLIPEPGAGTSTRPSSKRALVGAKHVRLAAAAGAASAGSMVTLGGFLVSGAVDEGLSEESGALLLTMGGALMIFSRLAMGSAADRKNFDRFRACGLMLLAGAVGYVCLAIGSLGLLILGTVFLFGAGWAFPGVFLLGIVEQHPDEPGAATGVVQSAIRIGAMLSPVTFGAIADHAGYRSAWLFSGALAVIGFVFMFLTSRAVEARAPIS